MVVETDDYALANSTGLVRSDELPVDAYEWADSARETAHSIIDSIEIRQERGREATPAQVHALENINEAALNWLDRT